MVHLNKQKESPAQTMTISLGVYLLYYVSKYKKPDIQISRAAPIILYKTEDSWALATLPITGKLILTIEGLTLGKVYQMSGLTIKHFICQL